MSSAQEGKVADRIPDALRQALLEPVLKTIEELPPVYENTIASSGQWPKNSTQR